LTRHFRAIDELLGRYGLVAVSEPMPVPESVLNENFRVETDAGSRFVRIYRKREPGSLHQPESLRLEAAAIAWAGARGIPVCPPLTDSSGRWLHAIGGRMLSLSPWVEGVRAQRGSVTPGQARAMGEMHGRIQAAAPGTPQRRSASSAVSMT
jgi:Ser/Thr protein kinase RdoA (MazF antagonist)